MLTTALRAVWFPGPIAKGESSQALEGDPGA